MPASVGRAHAGPDLRAVVLPLLVVLYAAGLAVAGLHGEWLAGAVVAAAGARLGVRLLRRTRSRGRPTSRPPGSRPPTGTGGPGRASARWLPGRHTRPAL